MVEIKNLKWKHKTGNPKDYVAEVGGRKYEIFHFERWTLFCDSKIIASFPELQMAKQCAWYHANAHEVKFIHDGEVVE